VEVASIFWLVAFVAIFLGAMSGSLPVVLGGGFVFSGLSILLGLVLVKSGLDNINESINKNR